MTQNINKPDPAFSSPPSRKGHQGRAGDEAEPGTPQTADGICPRCGGSGQAGNGPCPDCDGTGTVTVNVGDA
jgi:DnaJ-class molecular chaperone